MNGWKLTRVWRIDHRLVVAPTIEDAIALYKTYMGKDYRGEPKSICAISNDGNYDYNAIIKDK